MIQLTPHMRILLACEPIDFRKGLDSLVAVCRDRFQCDPFSGTLFLFRNKSGTALKMIIYDGHGYWLFWRRFSKGTLHWWPPGGGEKLTPLAAQHLTVLLYQGNPEQAQLAEPWRRLPLDSTGFRLPGR